MTETNWLSIFGAVAGLIGAVSGGVSLAWQFLEHRTRVKVWITPVVGEANELLELRSGVANLGARPVHMKWFTVIPALTPSRARASTLEVLELTIPPRDLDSFEVPVDLVRQVDPDGHGVCVEIYLATEQRFRSAAFRWSDPTA